MRDHRLHALVILALLAGCTAPTESDGANDSNADRTPDAVVSPSPTPVVPVPDAPSNGSVASAPGAPLVVSLGLADAKAFFAEGTKATLAISAGNAFDRVRAGVALPPGVELVSGTLSFEGPLSEGDPALVEAVIRASASGEHELRAWAEAAVAVGSRVAPSALLGVSGDATSARFFTPPARPPTAGVSLVAEGVRHATAIVRANLEGPAELVWVVPTSFGSSAGVRNETLTLAAQGEFERSMELDEAQRWEDGYVTLEVLLYPDPATDGRLYRDALYFWWADDALQVSETAPTSGQATGAGPATGGGTGSDAPPEQVP